MTDFGFTEQEVKELLAYCKAEFSDELQKDVRWISLLAVQMYIIHGQYRVMRQEEGWNLIGLIQARTVFYVMHLKYREGHFEKEYEALVTEGEVEVTVDFFNGLL